MQKKKLYNLKCCLSQLSFLCFSIESDLRNWGRSFKYMKLVQQQYATWCQKTGQPNTDKKVIVTFSSGQQGTAMPCDRIKRLQSSTKMNVKIIEKLHLCSSCCSICRRITCRMEISTSNLMKRLGIAPQKYRRDGDNRNII